MLQSQSWNIFEVYFQFDMLLHVARNIFKVYFQFDMFNTCGTRTNHHVVAVR